MVTVALVIGTIGPGPSYSAQIVPAKDSTLARRFLALVPDNVRVCWYNIDGADRDVLSEAIERLRAE